MMDIGSLFFKVGTPAIPGTKKSLLISYSSEDDSGVDGDEDRTAAFESLFCDNNERNLHQGCNPMMRQSQIALSSGTSAEVACFWRQSPFKGTKRVLSDPPANSELAKFGRF